MQLPLARGRALPTSRHDRRRRAAVRRRGDGSRGQARSGGDTAAIEVAVSRARDGGIARLVSHARRRAAAGAILRRGRRPQPAARRAWWRGRWPRWPWAWRSPTARSARSTRRGDATCPNGTTSRAAASRLRQLLEETSGLETGGDIARPAAPLALGRSRAPAGVRHRQGRAHVVRQRLRAAPRCVSSCDHEPGGFHNLSPANTQLAALILERVTGCRTNNIVERASVAAGRRRARRARARSARRHARGALLLARDGARTWHASLSLLATDGVSPRRRCCPRAGCRKWRGPRGSARKAACSCCAHRHRGTFWRWAAATTMAAQFWVIPRDRHCRSSTSSIDQGLEPAGTGRHCCCAPCRRASRRPVSKKRVEARRRRRSTMRAWT